MMLNSAKLLGLRPRMLAVSQRGFFDQIPNHQYEGVDELTLMRMVEPQTNTFQAQQPIEFDREGRMLIYDGLAANLKRQLGFFSIGSSLFGLMLFHSTEVTYGLDLNTLMHWGGISYFSIVSFLQLTMFRNKRKKINRVHLLQGGQVVRLTYNSGIVSDVPISAISQVSYNNTTTFLEINVGADNGTSVCRIELRAAEMINLPILYALTRLQVKGITQ